MRQENVVIELERAEALVLFELFSRFTDDESADDFSKFARFEGEQGSFYALIARLEESLPEIISSDYFQELVDARKRCKELYGF